MSFDFSPAVVVEREGKPPVSRSHFVGVAFNYADAELLLNQLRDAPVVCVDIPRSKLVTSARDAHAFFDGEA